MVEGTVVVVAAAVVVVTRLPASVTTAVVLRWPVLVEPGDSRKRKLISVIVIWIQDQFKFLKTNRDH